MKRWSMSTLTRMTTVITTTAIQRCRVDFTAIDTSTQRWSTDTLMCLIRTICIGTEAMTKGHAKADEAHLHSSRQRAVLIMLTHAMKA